MKEAPHAVLRPAEISERGRRLSRRRDQNNVLLGLAAAFVLHFGLILGFWLADVLGVQDLGDWDGPILVKIGVPDAPPSQAVDNPSADIPVPEPPVTEPVVPAEPVSDTPPAPPVAERPEAADSPESVQPEPVVEPAPPVPQPAAAAPAPARVLGDENGNSYELNFDGTEGDVGRAGAYEMILSYMPLPEVLDAAVVEEASAYLGMTADAVRAEIERYWEPVFGEYVKTDDPGGVPLEDRPYYWSLLVNSLKYDASRAEWRQMSLRPVAVEFVVQPSDGARGAELSDIRMVSRTNDPRIDEAVVYGLSRWVYFNTGDQPVRGRITYNFDR